MPASPSAPCATSPRRATKRSGSSTRRTSRCCRCCTRPSCRASSTSAAACRCTILNNVQNGLCPEDCGYCSQSKDSAAPIRKYPLKTRDEILAEAERAARAGVTRYCMVLSGRGPTLERTRELADLVREIKERFPIEVCVSVGLIDDEQARILADGRPRPPEPQPQHQRAPLPRDLLDAHLPGPRAHAARGQEERHRAVQRPHPRHGRDQRATCSRSPSRCASSRCRRSR